MPFTRSVVTLLIVLLLHTVTSSVASGDQRPRARDIGLVVGTFSPGPLNAITDVEHVRVGHATRVEGDDIRTGVTAIIPGPGNLYAHPVPAWIHVGNGYSQGQKSGEETHTLSVNEMPEHTHTIQASSDPSTSQDPTDTVLAQSGQIYKQSTNLVDMVSGTMTNTGGGQAHDNVQPYLALNFCIALQGLFPSRN